MYITCAQYLDSPRAYKLNLQLATCANEDTNQFSIPKAKPQIVAIKYKSASTD